MCGVSDPVKRDLLILNGFTGSNSSTMLSIIYEKGMFEGKKYDILNIPGDVSEILHLCDCVPCIFFPGTDDRDF